MPTGPELIAESYRQLIATKLAPLIAATPVKERPKGTPPVGRIDVRAQDRGHEERSDNYPFIVVIVGEMQSMQWTDEFDDNGLKEIYQCTYQVRVRVVCRSQGWTETDLERKRLSHAVTQIIARWSPAKTIVTEPGTIRARYRDSAEQSTQGPIGRTLAGADISFTCVSTEKFSLDTIAIAGTVIATVVHVSELTP